MTDTIHDTDQSPLHHGIAHDSATKHVTGRADYTDDLIEPSGTLHAYLGLSTIAAGRVRTLDLDAVRQAPGVVDVLTAADLPAANDISATAKGDEPLLAGDQVMFHGQPLFAVIADTRDAARRACQLAKVDYEQQPHYTDVLKARDAGMGYVTEPLTLSRGDMAAMDHAPHRISGQMRIGGQEHFYLESQIAMAIPGEDDEVTLYTSTQHPSEVQHMVAHALGVPSHAVVVNVRRMGGGFGGKESQMNAFACIAAIAAKRLGRAVKLRPDRDDDMTITGKRHDFAVDYQVGFDDTGKIHAVRGDFYARAGYAADLSGPVTDRALFHADNAYYYPAVHLQSHPIRTNTCSNTAFRGFGGPQGVIVAERMIEEIAYHLGRDPLEVRKANLYQNGQLTPYHQEVNDQILPRIFAELESSSDYHARRAAVIAHNDKGGVIRRGIALTPVKFGISFTATWYNQAGALVHIYSDGSIHLNHGGTEMGQGLHTKMAQVLADALGVGIDRIKITKTTTEKVPNTSATAASSGTDLNGMAVADAAQKLVARLEAFSREAFGGPLTLGERVRAGAVELDWSSFINKAYLARVPLSATGFYKTPDIHWNRATGQGRPFYYYAYGAAVSEVSVDTLTGEYVIERSDILHDVGQSLNPALDLGQVEGGFIQGVGWLTSEELWWDDTGRLRTHAPSTYKIPLASDRPKVFRTQLAQWSVNPERTIKRSKAVGEPPFMLGISVFEALNMAVASVAGYRENPRLNAPATPEEVLMAIERLRP